MRKAHREAAKVLYEEKIEHLNNTPASTEADDELYIDLHGLHPEEAIEYLDGILATQEKQGRQVLYAITGTGHHSKNGKDKVGKSVRNWLNELGYVFREFSVPGERGGYVGGILGIDVSSRRRSVPAAPAPASGSEKGESPMPAAGGRIQLLKREEISV